jgi:hypothetical protein
MGPVLRLYATDGLHDAGMSAGQACTSMILSSCVHRALRAGCSPSQPDISMPAWQERLMRPRSSSDGVVPAGGGRRCPSQPQVAKLVAPYLVMN